MMSTSTSLEDSIPFLEMLQGVESSQLLPFPFPLMQEPNFQLLLRLQHQQQMVKPLEHHSLSCVTHSNEMGMESESCRIDNQTTQAQRASGAGRSNNKIAASNKERKKRKRSTAKRMKNKDEVESQRMTHIAVERNRRHQMNDHLNVLRSLMPPPYVQKGDQASVIGGAIDFVKELEQLLQSLQAQKRIRQSEDNVVDLGSSSTSSSSILLPNTLFESSSSSSSLLLNALLESSSSSSSSSAFLLRQSGNEDKSGIAEIEVVVIQTHVNLKIQCQRRVGQLLKAIEALEDLRLSVLHLTITSMHSFAHYSFSLKIEDDCQVRSAEEVATAVHQIFTFINAG